MHFWSQQTDDGFMIIAEVDESKGDRYVGNRYQDDRTTLTLNETRICFGINPKHIDGDCFALSCILLFLPFIGNEVSFNRPVSQFIVDFLQSEEITKIIGNPVLVKSNIISKTIIENSGFDVKRSAIAIGGGFDAVAVRCLLPEAFAYHTVGTYIANNVFHYPAYSFYSKKHSVELQKLSVKYIWSNAENTVSPRGVTSWLNFIVPALLLKEDLGLTSVISGMIFESAYLSNGKVFSDFNKSAGSCAFYKLLRNIGVELIQGGIHLPEFVTAKICADNNLLDHVSFCYMGAEGGPCGKCFKCYRKYLLYQVLKRSNVSSKVFDNMDVMRYSNNYIGKLLKQKPIYFASSFKWLSDRVEKEHIIPDLKEALDRTPSIRFPLDKIYTRAYDVLPAGFVEIMRSRTHEMFDEMSRQEMDWVAQWNPSR